MNVFADKPTLGAFCFDGQRNSGFACEVMFAILSINNTVICNTTAGTHPYQVDILLDGNRVKTLVSGDFRKADIRISDGNQPFHEVNCTASYSGYNYSFSIVKKLHVIGGYCLILILTLNTNVKLLNAVLITETLAY